MFKVWVLLFLIFVSINIGAQNDTINKNQPIDSNKGFQINAKLINQELDINNDVNEKDISYLFVTKKKPLNMSYKLDLNKYLNPIKKPRNFMYGAEPLGDDVMVVKYFKGQNKTVEKFKTAQNLGTIESNTKFIRIEYRDHGLVDGDRVRVFLNKKEIDSNVHLDGLFYTLHIKLEKKGYNRIDIQAINQGYVGPNTAQFIVYDDKGNIIANHSWQLKTNELATLGIVKF